MKWFEHAFYLVLGALSLGLGVSLTFLIYYFLEVNNELLAVVVVGILFVVLSWHIGREIVSKW